MDNKIILIIFGMSLVTYIPRMIPLVVLSKFDMPPLFLKWLKYIPVAVLSALLLPNILISEQGFSIGLNNKSFMASLPCFFVAAKTRNLFITVLVGILSMLIFQRIL